MTKHRRIFNALHIKECCHCKTTSNLEVHHIDFNHKNDNPQNLVALCHECHVEIHRKNGNAKLQAEINLSIQDYVYDFMAHNQDVIFFFERGSLEIHESNGVYITKTRKPKLKKYKIVDMNMYHLILHDPRIKSILSSSRIKQQITARTLANDTK